MAFIDLHALTAIMLHVAVKYDYELRDLPLPPPPDSIRIPMELEFFYKIQKHIPELFRSDTSFTEFSALQATDNKIIFRTNGNKYWYIHTENEQFKKVDYLRENGLNAHISHLVYEDFNIPVYRYENGISTVQCDYLSEYLTVELAILIMDLMPILAQCTVSEETFFNVRNLFSNIGTFKKYPYSIFLGCNTFDLIGMRHYDGNNSIRFAAKNTDILDKLATENDVDIVYSRGL